jgi:hypothetical protein
LKNNGLFKKNLTLSKGNRMTKLGILVFVLRLKVGRTYHRCTFF